MMEDEKTPRVNGAMLKDMGGRMVILVAQNQGQLSDGSYNVTTSDNETVQVFLPPNETIEQNSFVQLIGNVTIQGTFEVKGSIQVMSPNFNMENYDKAITLANNAPYNQLFSE